VTTQTRIPEIKSVCGGDQLWLGPLGVPLVEEWARRYGATVTEYRWRNFDYYDEYPESIEFDYEVPQELDDARRRRTNRITCYTVMLWEAEARRQAGREAGKIHAIYAAAASGFRRGIELDRERLVALGYSAESLAAVPWPTDEAAADWEIRLEASRTFPDFD
jgi:hypothetical protein